MKITATIITYNEEQNIARAMESLRCCDEVVVVDSGSSDRTAEIAQKLRAYPPFSNRAGRTLCAICIPTSPCTHSGIT